MDDTTIAEALARARRVFARRPTAAELEDATAVANWRGGLRVVTRHQSGASVETDMPGVIGGSGDRVSPGWLARAGLAACAATSIAMEAASAGVALDSLEVRVDSRSDSRGLLGLADEVGHPVAPGPIDVELAVRLHAPGAAAERLREIVEAALARSPVQYVFEHTIAVRTRIDIDGN